MKEDPRIGEDAIPLLRDMDHERCEAVRTRLQNGKQPDSLALEEGGAT